MQAWQWKFPTIFEDVSPIYIKETIGDFLAIAMLVFRGKKTEIEKSRYPLKPGNEITC